MISVFQLIYIRHYSNFNKLIMESNECICEQYYDKLRQALSSLLAVISFFNEDHYSNT